MNSEVTDLRALSDAAEKQGREGIVRVCNRAIALIVRLQKRDKRRVSAVVELGDPRRTTALARELGALGGKVGGVVRAARLSPERRREIAIQGARKRWQKTDEQQAADAVREDCSK